jgi:transcription elongation factor Elf1
MKSEFDCPYCGHHQWEEFHNYKAYKNGDKYDTVKCGSCEKEIELYCEIIQRFEARKPFNTKP